MALTPCISSHAPKLPLEQLRPLNPVHLRIIRFPRHKLGRTDILVLELLVPQQSQAPDLARARRVVSRVGRLLASVCRLQGADSSCLGEYEDKRQLEYLPQ